MPFTGSEEQEITLTEAATLTANFRNAQAAPGFIKGAYFGGEGIAKLLAQENCVGMRVYYGRDDAGTPALVLVGVDANENDLELGIILDRGVICPPGCGVQNQLNS